MIVVSDTTPIHYLIEIGQIDVLEKLFGHIIIPQAVFSEMQRQKTPDLVKAWIDERPSWLEVKASDPLLFTPTKKIGEGEREAIALALELNADALLIDDRDGRKEAHRNNITVVTTLNILELGAQKKFLDLTEATQQLSKNTNFRMPPAEVIQEMLSRDAARKQREREQGRLEPHLEEPSKEPNDRNRDRDREIER